MRRFAGRLLILGMILCLLAGVCPAGADTMHTEVESATLEMEVQLGYNGAMTYGKPVPARITVRNRGEDLEAAVGMNAYISSTKYDRYEAEIFVPAGGERTVVLPLLVETRQETYTAEVVKDGKVLCAVNAEPDAMINPNAMMIGVLSTRPRNLSMLDISQENDSLSRYEYWQTVPLTAETLPDDPELLNAFGMIVLDDLDPALLTEKQQEALKNWIREGRVLICGGGTAAPRNLAFLGEMTALRAGGFTVSDCVHDALESFAGRKATETRPDIALARLSGEDPLVSDAKGNGLIWKITAGTGRIYVLAWEAGDPTLNSESLMHLFYQQMLVNEDQTLYNSLLYMSEDYTAAYNAGEYCPVPVRSNLLAAVLIVAAAAVLSCALWVILKKRGASKWMWLCMPVLALVAAAAVALLSGGSSLNSPVAAVTVSTVQTADGTAMDYTSVTAAAPRSGVHRYSMEGQELEIQVYNSLDYWDEDEDERPAEPTDLRVVYMYGERSEAAWNAESPWEEIQMTGVRMRENASSVQGEIWMEADGLHGTVTNGTAHTLTEGAVMTVYGFARIPDLAPGESADFALISETAADPYNPVFTDGKMLRNVSGGFYQVSTQRWFGKAVEDYNTVTSIRNGMTTSALNQLARAYNMDDAYSMESVVFIYNAVPKDAEKPVLYADGKPVESLEAVSMLTAELKYLTVGRTGVVFRAPGMDRAVRCELDEAGIPAGDADAAVGKYGYYYFPLSELPTFRFSPEGLGRMEISSLVIGIGEWYANEARCYLLNAVSGEWEETAVNRPVENPENYADANGNLYCQFRPMAGETYTDIPAPTLTLEGRVKDDQP